MAYGDSSRVPPEFGRPTEPIGIADFERIMTEAKKAGRIQGHAMLDISGLLLSASTRVSLVNLSKAIAGMHAAAVQAGFSLSILGGVVTDPRFRALTATLKETMIGFSKLDAELDALMKGGGDEILDKLADPGPGGPKS